RRCAGGGGRSPARLRPASSTKGWECRGPVVEWSSPVRDFLQPLMATPSHRNSPPGPAAPGVRAGRGTGRPWIDFTDLHKSPSGRVGNERLHHAFYGLALLSLLIETPSRRCRTPKCGQVSVAGYSASWARHGGPVRSARGGKGCKMDDRLV